MLRIRDFPAFQKAWRQGNDLTTLFGDKPFELKGSVGGSGVDNHRPDVAKIETLLGRLGYYKPLTPDGPSGWHNSELDRSIRKCQKDNRLAVDGVLKPGGPTIGALQRANNPVQLASNETVGRPQENGWTHEKDLDLGKDHEFNVSGPFRMDAHNPSVGLNGARVHVDWHQLKTAAHLAWTSGAFGNARDDVRSSE